MLKNARAVGVVLGSVVVAFTGIQGAAGASAPRAATMSVAAAAVPTARLTKLVAEAEHQTTLGISYLYAGGHGARPAPLNSHVDCSGLVRELYYYAFGVDIGGGSGDSMIRLSGEFTRTSHPVPGDVVLLGNGGSAPAYHSGIYIGTVNGEAAMVGSPTTGQNIKVQQSRGGSWGGDLMGYWHYNGATAHDSGSLTVPPPRLRGSFDAASTQVGGFSVRGWILDPQRMTGAARAQVLLDGRQLAVVGTGIVRSDVNRVFGAGGAHGFSATISAGPGRHSVCINARPSGTSSVPVSLGCREITIPAATPTRGAYDSLTMTKGTFAATGWAYDVKAPAASNVVRITSDGRLVALVRADLARSDVNRVLGTTGAHGFHVRVRAAAGRHQVCATSLPATATSTATALGCRSIAVA